MATSGKPSAAPAAARAARPASEALQKFQAGKIGLDEYLDDRVEQAVAHLEGLASVEELKSIRQLIREQLTQDPVLLALVGRVTGHRVE